MLVNSQLMYRVTTCDDQDFFIIRKLFVTVKYITRVRTESKTTSDFFKERHWNLLHHLSQGHHTRPSLTLEKAQLLWFLYARCISDVCRLDFFNLSLKFAVHLQYLIEKSFRLWRKIPLYHFINF